MTYSMLTRTMAGVLTPGEIEAIIDETWFNSDTDHTESAVLDITAAEWGWLNLLAQIPSATVPGFSKDHRCRLAFARTIRPLIRQLPAWAPGCHSYRRG